MRIYLVIIITDKVKYKISHKWLTMCYGKSVKTKKVT